MARHSKLIIFYLALQRVSQYLGHLITTETFLRLYTSAENGFRVAAYLQVCKNKRKESHVWPILPGNPRECM